jgi:uncharacterized protein
MEGQRGPGTGELAMDLQWQTMSLQEKSAALDQSLRALGSLLVAYSGGADSAFLAWAAHQALGERMLAVIADSASLPRKELAAALQFAGQHGIPTHILHTTELARPEYLRNDAQRCFHCKDELFTQMEEFRVEAGFAHIAYGMNVDDRAEFRPGQRAAALHHALAPLVEASLTKREIRALAAQAGLSIADKPASACLSSRIEYGRPVTVENLAQVERAEDGCATTAIWPVSRSPAKTCRAPCRSRSSTSSLRRCGQPASALSRSIPKAIVPAR